MASDLKFDVDAFSTAINEYNSVAEELMKIKCDLETHLQRLKDEYWQTQAGQAFLDKYNQGWADNVKKYILVLQELANLLKRAQSDYAQLEDEIKNIHL